MKKYMKYILWAFILLTLCSTLSLFLVNIIDNLIIIVDKEIPLSEIKDIFPYFTIHIILCIATAISLVACVYVFLKHLRVYFYTTNKIKQLNASAKQAKQQQLKQQKIADLEKQLAELKRDDQ